MLPMGTIVAVCMLLGLLFAMPYAVNAKLKAMPRMLTMVIGGLVFLAGGWNTFWHGMRNVTNFWGVAALISGVFMMLTAFYIVRFDTLPKGLQRIRPLVLFG